MTTKDSVRAFLDAWTPRTGREPMLISPTAELVTHALEGRGPGTPHTIFEDCHKAVGSALGTAPVKTIIDTPGEQFATIAYSVDYADGLSFRLRERHWPRLDALLDRTFGEKRAAFQDVAWERIGWNVRPQVSCWDDPFNPPAHASVGDSLCTAIFYFLAFAAAGDGQGAEQLANLVRLLPYAVPVGERPHGSGEWLFSLRPAVR